MAAKPKIVICYGNFKVPIRKRLVASELKDGDDIDGLVISQKAIELLKEI